jgi:hypothetical protein
VESGIYWGGPGGFSADRRVGLPTNRVNAVALHDVNNDGFEDIIFANGEGRFSYVYLSDRGNFDPRRRIELPTSDARGCAAADLNRDGFPDIVFTNHEVSGNPLTASYIDWGGPNGYSAQHPQELETVGAWGLSLADLNRDGRPDIVISGCVASTVFEQCRLLLKSLEGLSIKHFSKNRNAQVYFRSHRCNTSAVLGHAKARVRDSRDVSWSDRRPEYYRCVRCNYSI